MSFCGCTARQNTKCVAVFNIAVGIGELAMGIYEQSELKIARACAGILVCSMLLYAIW
jgi:hypothetical protein